MTDVKRKLLLLLLLLYIAAAFTTTVDTFHPTDTTATAAAASAGDTVSPTFSAAFHVLQDKVVASISRPSFLFPLSNVGKFLRYWYYLNWVIHLCFPFFRTHIVSDYWRHTM